MSRFRRISLAAAAATAALACTVPTSASAISINAVSGDAYKVSGSFTSFTFSRGSAEGDVPSVGCFHADPWGSTWLGPGIAYGQASTPFKPRFPNTHPDLMGGCQFVDDDAASPIKVEVSLDGAFMLTLDNLSPVQSPYYTRYDGRLWLHSYSSLHMRPAAYPGCRVTIAGPQEADFNSIAVDDDEETITLDATGATFATTKTASCPSTIGDEVTLYHWGYGWRLQGVTVTP